MAADADLEIGIEASGAAVGAGLGYTVQLRHRRGTDELKPVWGDITLDLDRLDEAGEDYGAELTRQVFADTSLVEYFRDALRTSQGRNVCLRVRLNLGRGAETLHSLKWERLELPFDDGSGTRRPLSLHQQIYFARFLGSLDWRPVQLRRKGERLGVLVAVANPSDPEKKFGFATIDVDAEVDRARRHLGSEPLSPIEPGSDALAKPIARTPTPLVNMRVISGADTLNQIVAGLQAEETDVLYLVCHGKLDRTWSARRVVREQSLLFLEGSKREVAPTSGRRFVRRLTELLNPPRLILLASCQSGGAGDESLSGEEGALSAIGPQLAEAGIPAVLALQAQFPMSTAATFFIRFFEEFSRHGQVDRATTGARGLLRDSPAERDAWIPVLYTRLSDGKIWYVPGMAETPGGRNVGWDALIVQIKESRDVVEEIGCTPVLGPGMLEPMVGPIRELARRWADESGFALAPHQREDLPQLNQFLIATQRRAFLPRGLNQRIDLELSRRFGALKGKTVEDRLDSARGKLAKEPHRLLAQLPFPLYITTNADDQLRRALVAEGRRPRALIFPWHERPEKDKAWPKELIELDADYEPTADEPLVYYLFGRSDLLHSLVLTEDDYFAFLTGVPFGMKKAPTIVLEALVDSALMFLGFRLEGWDFRVLFRSILSLGERLRLNEDLPNVAAQVAPEEGRHIDTERARDYLQKTFGQVDLSIYWGTAEDFLCELCDRAREGGLRLCGPEGRHE
ncbi:MAG: CHAT domain-containing protein [Isosphaeraceae bacterium]